MKKPPIVDLLDAIGRARVLLNEQSTKTNLWHAQQALISLVAQGHGDALHDLAAYIKANLPAATDYVATHVVGYPKNRVPRGFGKVRRKRVKL